MTLREKITTAFIKFVIKLARLPEYDDSWCPVPGHIKAFEVMSRIAVVLFIMLVIVVCTLVGTATYILG
jgi:hypothetical protein